PAPADIHPAVLARGASWPDDRPHLDRCRLGGRYRRLHVRRLCLLDARLRQPLCRPKLQERSRAPERLHRPPEFLPPAPPPFVGRRRGPWPSRGRPHPLMVAPNAPPAPFAYKRSFLSFDGGVQIASVACPLQGRADFAALAAAQTPLIAR